LFVEKVYDVIGLYINPPEAAVVLCVLTVVLDDDVVAVVCHRGCRRAVAPA
jgi:hypothetical protein